MRYSLQFGVSPGRTILTSQSFGEFSFVQLESDGTLHNPFELEVFKTNLESTNRELYYPSGGHDSSFEGSVLLLDLENQIEVNLPQPFQPGEIDFLTGSKIVEEPVIRYYPPDPLASTPPSIFESGTFVVGESGQVSVDYVFDGGYYQGELAVFSLMGMEEFDPDSKDFIREAARRSLSGTSLGHVVIADRHEGARVDGQLLGEPRNWNRGQYVGVKTFEMTPGDRFGVMLVPNGAVSEVYKRPGIGGNRKPLFSMATANPEDAFHVGQVADVTGDGRAFAIEDQRADRASDRDYNDIVFRFRGATGDALSIDELIDPELDWRDSDLGRIILEPDTPNRPQVSVTFDDTGLSNNDGITAQIAIAGSVSDSDRLSRLWANVEGFDPVEITDWLQSDGTFEIDRDRFVELLDGTSLVDSDYTLVFQTEDIAGNVSDLTELSLTLDRTEPTAIFGLSPDSDTPPPDDGATELAVVTLSGQTEAGSRIVMSGTTREVLADSTGYFEFTDVELELGENVLAIEVTDPAGNQGQLTQTLVRLTPNDPDIDPPLVAVQLTDDTGTASGVTSNPGVSGTVSDSSSISQFVVRLDGQTTPANAIDYLEADGSFALDRAALEALFGPLPDGTRQLHFQAVDEHGNLSETTTLSFTLDTTVPALVFGLDPNSDTPPTGDNITEADIVTLVGTTEAGATVTFQGNSVTADINGQFSVENVALDLGENHLNLQVVDGAGNAQSIGQTILREDATVPDTTPPVISASLANDTGTSASDGLTSNPAISGTVIDTSAISGFVVGFATDRLIDISDALSPDGQFALDKTRLEAIFGTSIPDGSHTLYLQAVDERGNLSELFSLGFTLDTAQPGLTIGLDPAFDTLPTGDGQTAFETVTLVGSTDAGARVELLETGRTTVADDNGHFTLTDIALVLGDNELTVVSTDTAGNSKTLKQTLTRVEPLPIDEDPPAISAQLANDTGRSGTDATTTDPTISGSVADISEIDYLLADLDGLSSAVDVSDLLQDDGSFTLSPDKLAELNGESLADGEHTLSLQAADEYGNLSGVFEVTFVLDTTSPSLTLDFGDSVDSNGETEAETVTVVGETEPNGSVQLRETGTTVTADATGHFELTDVALDVGDNTLTVVVTDVAGNATEQQQTVTRLDVPDDILLEERDGNVGLFNNVWEGDFVVPETPSVLSLELTDLNFDVSDGTSMADALEIAIVDETGQTLVRTISQGRDTLLNLTENQPVTLAPDVEFDGRIVRVALSDIEPGTTATVQVRLVNNDKDLETAVRFKPFKIEAGELTDNDPVVPIAPSATDAPTPEGEWVDVSSSVRPSYRTISFNRDERTLLADLALENIGSYWFDAPLRVGVKNFSDPSVRLRGTDGVTAEGVPYYDFSSLVTDGTLSPGNISEAGTLEFYNPNGVQFDGELVVWSQLNRSPQITSDPDTEALLGNSYNPSIVAEDPDGDVLSYELVARPSGMEIDAQTGEVTWNPDTDALGNHDVRVRVGDGRGGEAEQVFALSVVENVPNRPPVLTSTPIVDANVNGEYLYQVTATDADGDVLEYSLVEFPEGMEIDAQTGEIIWTPGDDALDFQSVVVSVEDGRDGVTQQVFDIFVRPEAGNNSPIVLSDPVTQLNLLEFPNPATGNVEPTRIDLDLAPGEVATESISITLPDSDPVGKVDLVFALDISGSNQSGSADNDFTWTADIARQVEAALQEQGIDARYALVEFVEYANHQGNIGPGSNLHNLHSGVKYELYNSDNVKIENSPRTYEYSQELPDSFLGTTLPTDGTYMLVVSGEDDEGSGNYGFKVLDIDRETLPRFTSIPSTSEVLNFDTPIEGTLENLQARRVLSFEGTKGQQIYYDSLVDSSRGGQTNLVDPDGQVIWSNFSSRNSPIFTLEKTGKYYVELFVPDYNNSSNEYSFILRNIESANSLSFDRVQSIQLPNSREAILYKFEGTPGKQVFFESLSDLGNSGNWTVYSHQGEAIATGNLSTDIQATLNRDGTYALVIENKSDTELDFEFQSNWRPARSITWGESVLGEISDLVDIEDVNIYTFEANQGSQLILDSLQNKSYLKYDILTPSGTQLSGKSLSDIESAPLTLPEDGTYQIQIRQNYGSSRPGIYEFRLLNPAENALLINEQLDLNFESGRESFAYQFEGEAGQTFTFDSILANPGISGSNSRWNLYSQNHQNIVESWNKLTSDREIILPVDGFYTLVLSGRSDTEFNYQFQTEIAELNTFDLNINEPIDGKIEKIGERDVFKFNGIPGKIVYYDALLDNTNEIDYKIISPNGTIIKAKDSPSDSNLLTLQERGEYKIVLDGETARSGNYQFQFLDLLQNVPLSLETNYDLQFSLGKDTKIYTIEGKRGQTLEFDTENSHATNWQLYSSNGLHVLGKNNGVYQDFQVTFDRDGIYPLVIQNQRDSSIELKFNVREVSTSDPVPDPTRPDLESLEMDRPISVHLTPDKPEREYRFEGDAGQRLFFDTSLTSGGLYWSVFDSTGTQYQRRNLREDFDLILPADDTYVLKLQSRSNEILNYEFQVVTPETRRQPLDFAIPVSNELDELGTQHIYTFSGSAGQQVYFDFLTSELDRSQFKSQLVSPSGTEILINTSQTYDPIWQQPIELKESGTYRSIVESEYAETGSYQFQLLDAAAEDPVAWGESIDDRFQSRQESAIYQFDGKAGQNIQVVPSSDFTFGNVDLFARVTSGITSSPPGFVTELEDGYQAIAKALSAEFRPDAAVGLVLLTDERRDAIDRTLHFGNVLDALLERNVALTSALEVKFLDNSGNAALGIDADGLAYVADGSGGYTRIDGSEFTPQGYYPDAKETLIDLTWAAEGTVWDIDKLRDESDLGVSFANAFVDRQVDALQERFVLDVVSSKTGVPFANATGVLSDLKPGETAAFDVDFSGDSRSHRFDLLLTQPETNRILGSVPVSINANTVYFYPVNAIDPDGDTLSYRLADAPDGASIDAETGLVNWTPSESGTYRFAVEVSDGRGGRTVQDYDLHVSVGEENTAPTIVSDAPNEATVGATYTYTVEAEDAAIDCAFSSTTHRMALVSIAIRVV